MIKSEKHQRVLNFVKNNEGATIPEIESFTDCSRAIVNTLIKNGYLEIVEQTVKRDPLANKQIEHIEKLILNDEQLQAYNSVRQAIKENRFEEFLLFGVTGSGKTEIYLQLIDDIVKEDKAAIMLVPEISLTPQMIERFIARFGKEQIAVLHSKLSIGERHDEWERIRENKAKIIIGARSAIFAPIPNLGLIIIDEEHDSSYKSESNPRYDAKEVALQIAQDNKIPLLLGSATPDISTYYNATDGNNITLLELTKRANNASLPNVTIVDMKNEVKKGNSLFSEILIEKMREKLENNEQVILFLNRRGFSSYQLCSSCGEVIKCPNCDITLTYHKTSGMNRCHYCGYAEKKKDICPKCKNESLKDFGQGTEKVEEEIKKIFQSYRTVRMDIDTTTKKGAHEKIINSFLNHEYDILVGTQMIAKGLDFPLVSLVGVINADTILNFPDFRSSERTYQMLSQVSGRAGRGNIKGDVIIQTFNPDNYSIELSKTHNYVDFFNKEIKIRKDLKYPPYYFISLIKIGSKDYNLSLSESKKIANYIKENISEDMIVLGPSVSGVSRVNKIYYFQIIIKFRNKEKMREILNNVSDLENNNKVSISIDINP